MNCTLSTCDISRCQSASVADAPSPRNIDHCFGMLASSAGTLNEYGRQLEPEVGIDRCDVYAVRLVSMSPPAKSYSTSMNPRRALSPLLTLASTPQRATSRAV